MPILHPTWGNPKGGALHTARADLMRSYTSWKGGQDVGEKTLTLCDHRPRKTLVVGIAPVFGGETEIRIKRALSESKTAGRSTRCSGSIIQRT